MRKLITAFVLCSCLAATVFGFSSDGSTLKRTADRWTASTNSPVVFTVTFTNGGSAPLRGFYYADQMPAGLLVQTLGVSLNGMAITNYSFEVGQADDVYPGCIPCRWVIEQPMNFIENNPIPPGGTVQITYSIACSISGSFPLNEYSWAGYDPGSTNSAFGYSEVSDQKTLTFLASPPSALLSLSLQSNGLTLHLNSSPPGCSYIIQQSSDLSNWTTWATNVSPFDVSLPGPIGLAPRFFRAVWVP